MGYLWSSFVYTKDTHVVPDVANTLLPALGANAALLTTAGFSSGATMAMQLHFIFSADVKGAGLLNGRCFLSRD